MNIRATRSHGKVMLVIAPDTEKDEAMLRIFERQVRDNGGVRVGSWGSELRADGLHHTGFNLVPNDSRLPACDHEWHVAYFTVTGAHVPASSERDKLFCVAGAMCAKCGARQ